MARMNNKREKNGAGESSSVRQRRRTGAFWVAARVCSCGAAAGDDPLRSSSFPVSGLAPPVRAEELLRAEGFTDVEYLSSRGGHRRLRAPGLGDLDISQGSSPRRLSK